MGNMADCVHVGTGGYEMLNDVDWVVLIVVSVSFGAAIFFGERIFG
jgi:hypothetical protein